MVANVTARRSTWYYPYIPIVVVKPASDSKRRPGGTGWPDFQQHLSVPGTYKCVLILLHSTVRREVFKPAGSLIATKELASAVDEFDE